MNKHYLILLVTSLFCISCKKEKKDVEDCLPNLTSYRQIVNKRASIRQLPNGQFNIIEMGTIDSRLEPCNLPIGFQVNDLQVTISGDVKATFQPGPGPCCAEGFVIREIRLWGEIRNKIIWAISCFHTKQCVKVTSQLFHFFKLKQNFHVWPTNVGV